MLISIGSWLLEKTADKGFDELSTSVISSDAFNQKFYNAVKNTSDRLQITYPEILGGSINYFFTKPEVFNELIKLLFTSSKSNIDIISSAFDIATLPPNFILEFIEELKIELLQDRDFSKLLNDQELYVTILNAGNNIDLIASNSSISREDIYNILRLIERKVNNVEVINRFKNKYKQNALITLSQVNFIGLGVDNSIKRNRKKLQDIFVKPNFISSNSELSNIDSEYWDDIFDHPELISYSKLLDTHERIVILGKQGSGKSTLVKSIICNILLEKEGEFDNTDILKYLPFRIELRKYLAYKKENRGNILNYLSSLLEEEYSIYDLNEEALHNIINYNKTFFFFDGLDEIFNIQDKINIKDDIERFHKSFSNVKSITTSRVIGYNEAKLNEEEFYELQILDFNEEQIREYVTKWYEKEEDDVDIRNREIDNFFEKKNEIDSELIRNPLLLSLIIILYRNILKIPESKLEIYQSCTKTLVDKWDAEKHLVIELESKIYKDKEKIFADLAYWQYEQLSSESVKITYEKAKHTVANSILNKLKFGDEFSINDFAESFMSYAEKRSIYFDNNFTHKTFLEYYTAYWIYSNIEKKHKEEERNNLISKYIGNPFWHIVLELLFNLIDKDQADTDIIDGIIEKQLKTSDASLPFILTVVSSLKNVSQEVISGIVNKSINYLLLNANTRFKLKPEEYHKTLNINVFSSLRKFILANNSNRDIFIKELRNIESKIRKEEEEELLYILLLELEFHDSRLKEFQKGSLFNLVSYEKAVERNPYLYFLDDINFVQNTSNKFKIDKYLIFIELYGKDQAFKDYPSIFDTFLIYPFIYNYLYYQFQEENISSLILNLDKLAEFGITKNIFIKSFYERRHSFYVSEIPVEYILNIIDTTEDIELKIFLFYIIISSQTSPFFSSNERTSQLYLKSKSQENIALLNKLEEKSSFEEKANLLLSFFNYDIKSRNRKEK